MIPYGHRDTAHTRDPFRRGMSAFLKPVVEVIRQKRLKWRIIPCGGRRQAYDAFRDVLFNEPDVFNILLVDSEDPVAITVSPWKHLKNRQGDQWKKPRGTNDKTCQMMVACMESWFIADPQGLRRHYGPKFDMGKLPPADRAENLTTIQIADALKQSVRNTNVRDYHKIRDGAKLLETVDPTEVRKYCKWCDRLFETLGEAVD